MEKILQRMSLHPSPHHLKDQTKNKTTRSGNFVYVMQMRCKDFVNSWLIIVQCTCHNFSHFSVSGWWCFLSILIPGLFPHPPQLDPSLGPDLDRGRLRRGHGLLHGLHQVLGVTHQHLCGLNVLFSSCKWGAWWRISYDGILSRLSYPELRALWLSLWTRFSVVSQL